MARSQNGYPANNRRLIRSYKVPGSTRKLAVRQGDVATVLIHWAAWFDKNIERIDLGRLDDWGYAERPIRGSSTTLSNHASGTAIDLNALKHPMGRVNTFSSVKRAKIRKQLKWYRGVIRWGGDYKGRKDEMHFEINRNMKAVSGVALKIKKQLNATATLKAIKNGTEYQGIGHIQKALNKVMGGTDLDVDNKWGPKSAAMFKAFRRKVGLPGNNPGPVSLEKLGEMSGYWSSIR